MVMDLVQMFFPTRRIALMTAKGYPNKTNKQVYEDSVCEYFVSPHSLVSCHCLCQLLHPQRDNIIKKEPINKVRTRKRKTDQIMQQCHVLSVAITTSSGTRTLQMGQGAHLQGNVHNNKRQYVMFF